MSPSISLPIIVPASNYYNPFNGSDLANPSGFDTTQSNAAALRAVRTKTTRFSKATLALANLKLSNARRN